MMSIMMICITMMIYNGYFDTLQMGTKLEANDVETY